MPAPKDRIVRYVDLDGTLAEYDGWKGHLHIGNPIPKMLKRVLRWIKQEDEVVIFTARISPESRFTKAKDVEETIKAVEDWCVKYIGQKLKVTCEKGYFDKCYDDRSEHISRNKGMTREERLLESINSMRKHSTHNDEGILNWVVEFLNSKIKEQNS